MAKVLCGGFYLGDNLTMNGNTLEVGSDNMELSDAGLEVSTGALGDTLAVGCVEDESGDLVNGMRGTDDVYIYAGEGKDVKVGNDTYIEGDIIVDGDIIGDKRIVLTSSTSGSTQQFYITVDDSGVITVSRRK